MMTARAGRSGLVRRFLLAGTAAAAVCAPSSLLAQEAASEDSYLAEEDASTGNDIVVTATKREQTLQDVPVAVTVTTAETIERAQIRDLRDLQTVVPSLIVGQRQSSANTNFFIRGFGNGANNVGIEPSVGVFVDNVYRSRTAAQITELPDVQRIEVLRGPQSTLFGKNASAGVISIVTQEPRFRFGGSAELTVSNFDGRILKGHVTGPLSESVAFSLAAGLNKRDGFFEDLGTGNRTNERDRWFTRGQLLLEPTGSDLSVRLIADYDKLDENCCAVVNAQSSAATAALQAVGGRVTDPTQPFAGFVYNNADSTNAIENYGFSGQIDYEVGPLTLTSITAYRESNLDTDQDSDYTAADLLVGQAQQIDVSTFTQEFRVDAEIGDRVNLLLGAFYINEAIDQGTQVGYGSQARAYANLLVQGRSGGALSLPALEAAFGQANGVSYAGQFYAAGQGIDENYTLDSEALSLFGQMDIELTDGLVLTLGGNYTLDNKRFATDTVSNDVFSSIDFNAPQYRAFRQDLLFRGALAQGVGNALQLNRRATQTEIAAFAGANPAAYGQVQAGATAFAVANRDVPTANPLAGLQALQFLPPFLNVPNAVEDGETEDDNFSYTARLAYDVSPELNLYASYATGFKASSVNLSRDSRPSQADAAALAGAGLLLNNLRFGSRFARPEESRVMEGGLKYNTRSVSANLTVFDQQIEGFQSNLFTGTGFALLNAGKQSTFGVEFEGEARVGEYFVLNAGVTYLDPIYDDFAASAVGDISGTRPAGIPPWTIVVGAQHQIPLGNGMIVPRVSYLWQSEHQLVEGLPAFLVRGPDGSIVNAAPAIAAAAPFTRETNDVTASLAYELDSGLIFSVWGRNLLDDRDFSVIFDSVVQPEGISGYPNDPRTYGATVRYRF